MFAHASRFAPAVSHVDGRTRCGDVGQTSQGAPVSILPEARGALSEDGAGAGPPPQRAAGGGAEGGGGVCDVRWPTGTEDSSTGEAASQPGGAAGRTSAVLVQSDMPVVIASGAFHQTKQKTVEIPQLPFFDEVVHISHRGAEADSCGPTVCRTTEVPLLLGTVIDVPVVQVVRVPPCRVWRFHRCSSWTR